MLTSHCQFCGAPKPFANYADEYCPDCAKVRKDTRITVEAENATRSKYNADVLTPENKAALERAATSDYTGSAARELTHSLGLKPLIDMSAALRTAMAQRAHHTNTGHADPRAVWNPGLTDARVSNLGMAAHVAPNTTVERQR